MAVLEGISFYLLKITEKFSSALVSQGLFLGISALSEEDNLP